MEEKKIADASKKTVVTPFGIKSEEQINKENLAKELKSQIPKACFVYGSLRPDDDSGQMWTKQACEGMTARKAIVKGAQLFKDSYAVAILERPGHHVVGWVLTHDDDAVFKEKLEGYDRIEGYNADNPEQGLYMRDVTEATLVDEDGNETGETEFTYIYHRKGISENEPVEDGDWMKRDRSKDGVPCGVQ